MQRFLTYLFICLRRTGSELPNAAFPAEGPSAARWSQQRSRWCPAAGPAAVPAVPRVSRTVSSLPVGPPRPGVRLAGSGAFPERGNWSQRRGRPAVYGRRGRPARIAVLMRPLMSPAWGHLSAARRVRPVQYGLFAWPARERRPDGWRRLPRCSPISRGTSCLWEQRPTAFCTDRFLRSNLGGRYWVAIFRN